MMDGALAVERDHTAGVNQKRKRQDSSGDSDEKIRKTETDVESHCIENCVELNSVKEVMPYEGSPLPAQHYDLNTTEPISSGLKSLDELLSWKRSEASPFNVATVPMGRRQTPLASCSRRTLVCHDMMGGYLEDRFIQGTTIEAPYVFYHWDYIDIFNYFSHNMVTIPPATWTNAAHKHGVHSLGTFITEWTDGEKVCEQFLATEETYRTAADKLVQIAHCYGFDGWLINIENKLSAVAVKNVELFLRYLTAQMHERVPGSLVIWYDSVLDDGLLKWQNELNDRNRVFFDACDGIFTNYNWTESSLQAMVSHTAAQRRLADIYVGVDVFARGEVVGGKFETNKALELVRKYNLSTAIFAPGWVYECLDKADFHKNQDKFWSLLSDYLYVHQHASPLPFVSSFCQGFGRSVYWKGQVEQDKSWFNLNAQEIQPLYSTTSLEGGGWLRSRSCPAEAWAGGSSLLLEGWIPRSLTKACARIFSLHMPLPTKTLISFVYKPLAGLNVSLELRTTDALLCSSASEAPSSSVFPVALSEDNDLVKQFTENCGRSGNNGWTSRCFLLELSGCALREVCVCVAPDNAGDDLEFSCRIGEIMVLDANGLFRQPVPVQDVCVYDDVWKRAVGRGEGSPLKLRLSATLRWQYPAQHARHFRVHWRHRPDPGDPPSPLTLIGRAYSTLYRVVELEVPLVSGLMELLVEPVSREGFSVLQTYWGICTLSYPQSTADV
ncbi:cytosolic endo-beta-N-acetylglucosaminidase [Brachyhypopomus gauderio]|uniref:cytosolic endo-beta-N-acetylglucosaminidase n=1 Tax=Brachyhypopomus gauderio TaxID=698409 RepID=UPI0040411504